MLCGCMTHTASAPCLWSLASSLASRHAAETGESVQTSPLSRPVKLSSFAAAESCCPAPPMTTRPLPVFPPDVSVNKKRRRSNGSTTTTTEGGGGGKAMFLPLKKKRKSSRNRSKSPPPGRRSSRTQPDTSSKTDTKHDTDQEGGIKVRTVSPTVRGISEAARILLASTDTQVARAPTPSTETSNSVSTSKARKSLDGVDGILSFPTETVYTLATCVRVKQFLRSVPRSSSTSSSEESTSSGEFSNDGIVQQEGVQSSGQSLQRLLRLKGLTNVMSHTHMIASDPDAPLLYIHTPSQHRNFFQFTKPKTFVVKKPKDEQEKLPAVTFSETREVMDRLSAAFWPGPVVIYGPAKMRRTSGMSTQERQNSPSNGVQCDGEAECSPILPASVLVHAPPRCGDAEAAKVSYIGIRCPSHPLALRVLEEVYSRNPKRKSSGRRGGCSSVVVGFTASVSHSPRGPEGGDSRPTTARGVCAQLLATSGTDIPENTELRSPTTVHVLNGEDRREIFSHVTCEFGAEASVSLLVDDSSRTVRILRRCKDENGGHNHVRPVNVMRALLRTPSLPPSSEGDDQKLSAAANRVVTAALQRWKVAEEAVIQ